MTSRTLHGVYATTYTLSAPVTNLTVASSAYLGAGLQSAASGHYTIANSGVIIGDQIGLGLGGSGVVRNFGTIRGRSTSAGGSGVLLFQGGSVSNLGAASAISGSDGWIWAERAARW